MSEQSVEVLRGVYEAFNRRDIAGILDRLDPDVEIPETEDLAYAARLLRVLGPRFVMLSGRYHGHDEVRRMFESVWEIADWFTAEPQELVAVAEDCVLVMVRLRARARDTGLEGEALTAHLWRVGDGRGKELRVYADRGEAMRVALEAVGRPG